MIILKPTIIGITGNHTLLKNDEYRPFKINYSSCGFTTAITAAGGVPIILPIGDPSLAESYVALIDGLLLTGGQDVSPQLYNEEPRNVIGETAPDRDAIEVALIQAALKQNKPILGICRGMQLLNVTLGGSLYQDLTTEANITIQHVQKAQPEFVTHSIKVKSDSHIATLVADGKCINSVHHQGIKQLAPSLTATAWSQDEVIEAVEWIDDTHSIIGVQWHPELTFGANQESMNLFIDLITRSKQKMVFPTM
ncbi:gamma-glutamyl-gamma-aminobutyrate hydrolase family protein [Aerococcaceae bacterium NML210727]|nr:gamma-glutamyl-gamma-aminobutyrate hydrolase family protein [Aerococcaceae bacterium NML210727]MCW6654968.1 gamma-glutamyl-gamma-aminobutyrate hydrolase family protein [Aerococcaceae bacterium NML201296]MCW6663430.1 gamma-glutamyl-gamma-aminobutyrate hydrolase family protein [Aerococcaceae bacterium NML190073]MCW6665241.1 gamma-glutamyl-gamma-aminobutyrate hydrolase family protein [Aerococcaceae bacterium NML191219]MCW6677186.1 gamma-glutamyl-gamma-aminobutyrate hydrolase family protein [Aer